MNSRVAKGAKAGSGAERRFALVKFYGPKRNAGGKLWGFMLVADGSHAGEEVYVAEPHGGNAAIAEGSVRIVELTETARGVQVVACAAWTADADGVEMLLAASASLRSNDAGRQVLNTLVRQIPSESCPSLLLPYQPDDVLAARVRDRVSFLNTLMAALSGDGSLGWLRRFRELPALTGPDVVRLAAAMGDVWHPELAGRVLDATRDLDEPSIEALCGGSPYWREVLVQRLPAIDVVESPTLWSELSDEQCWNVAVAAATTKEGARRAVEQVGPARLADFVQRWGDRLNGYQIASLHPSFVAAVPSLLEALREGAVLTMCAKALRDADGPNDRSHVEMLAVERLAAWSTASDSTDRAEGARRLAGVLLRLPPQVADQLAAEDALLPELQHILGCRDVLTCLGDARLHVRLGHAVGALAAADVAGREQVASTRRLIAAAFLGSDQPLTPERAGQVLLRIADDVRSMFDCRELDQHIGALLRALPRCTMGEAPFCEAKPPGRDQEGNVYSDPFCPRTKRGCPAGVVAPRLTGPVERWGLMELLGSSGRAPFDMHGKTLINGVAGWANRLYELRERMACSVCHAGLTFDPKYSKKYDAAYHSTVMECSQHCGAPPVYFNHCYSCHALIDSRESSFVEPPPEMEGFPASRAGLGRYLCIHCANGSKPWCPQCGEPSSPRAGGTSTTCTSCGYVVHPSRRAALPRVAAPLADGPWADVKIHLPEHPGWSQRPEGTALRRLADARLVDEVEEPF